MTVPPPALQIALADRYEVIDEIGRGAMATVYCAHDQRHDRQVALKVLDSELSLSLGVERFLREIKLIASLQHPHILPLFDSGKTEGFFYYVMPLVTGGSLGQRLARERTLPVDDALAIAREVASALDYAHRQGVIHRDIKPANILLQDGHAVVADFGIARAISASATTTFTQAGLAIGTPAYMSPEQAVGDREIDGRSDVYALGCTLYEMLVGEPPFNGPTSQAIIARRFVDTPSPVRRLRTSVPASIDRAIATALALEPSDRFPSASQFALALQLEHANVAVAVPTPANPDAAMMYEEAQRIVRRRDQAQLPRAVELLARASIMDPAFGGSSALLAVATLLSADLDVPVAQACAAARAAAHAALGNGASWSDAHAALGFAHTLMWEWADADRELRRAIDLASESSLAHHWRGIHLCAAGRLDEARDALTRAVEIDPTGTAPRCALAVASYYARDYDSAVRTLRRVAQEDSAAPTPRVLLALALAARGATDEAMRQIETSVDLAGELQPFAIAAMGCVLAQSGRRSEAASAREELRARALRADISPFYDAAVSAAVGEPLEALAALERAVAQRDSWMLALKVHPWLDPLRQEAGFASLVAHVGL